MKIVLKNLSKRFPNRNKKIKTEVIAVDNFNFEIPDGKLVGLLGPSGCGKSTTLNLISGLETPSEGQIFFDETDVTKLPPEKRGVGLVFQNYALYPHLTVYKNIQFPLDNLKGKDKLSKEDMDKRIREAARLVQIDELLDRKPNELSGGQQQRVAIARAMVKIPKVLLLDEPLSNLDARLRIQTREEIKRIQTETGVTTIFVTHDQEEAMSISDVIVVMKDGVLQQIGKPQEVYDHPINLFVAKFLGTPPINVFAGKIKDNKLFIGDTAIMNIHIQKRSADLQNTNPNNAESNEIYESDVYVAIRPEGFIPDDNGTLKCELGRIEVMGRDVSIVSKHSACLSEANTVRSIVNSDISIDTKQTTVTFSVKPHKLHVFDRITEERIDIEVIN